MGGGAGVGIFTKHADLGACFIFRPHTLFLCLSIGWYDVASISPPNAESTSRGPVREEAERVQTMAQRVEGEGPLDRWVGGWDRGWATGGRGFWWRSEQGTRTYRIFPSWFLLPEG